jgi:hypothetical protein
MSERREGDVGVGALTLEIITPEVEIRRYHAIQATTFTTPGDLLTLTLISPSGKVGNLTLYSASPFGVSTIKSWPADFQGPTSIPGPILVRDWVDAPAGWILRAVIGGGAPGAAGRLSAWYERITPDRIKASYGPDASLNVTTGEVRYPVVSRRIGDPIDLTRSV